MKKNIVVPNLIYLFFAFMFFCWMFLTYRNIVHMDMIFVISTKIKHLYEQNLQIQDFILQPLFITFISIVITFINAKVFHLNTYIDIAIGGLYLLVLGYKYLNQMISYIIGIQSKILFALLISFLTFSLHKWEASLTSFGFHIYFISCFSVFNFFYLISYIDQSADDHKKRYFHLFWILSLLMTVEAASYYLSFLFSAIILLVLIKFFNLLPVSKINWYKMFFVNIALLLFTFIIITILSNNPTFQLGASNVSIKGFLSAFFEQPFWMIKFYLIALSGPFWGEADSYIELRALFGALVLTAYGLAIYYVVRKKDKRLLVPASLILCNLFCYVFVTTSRYVTNSVIFGSSSRYTAFTLLGVLGLGTILVFYVLEEKRKLNKYICWLFLIMIVISQLYVNINQLKISPHRTISFNQIKTTLLTGKNLEVLQADKKVSLEAIEVLKKYNLNVYYDLQQEAIDLNKVGRFVLAVGSPKFKEITKSGFYENEKGISWTNGNATIILDKSLKVDKSLILELITFMPPVSKNVTPQISLIDFEGKIYHPVSFNRDDDNFIYKFHLGQSTYIQGINIVSETIEAFHDQRTLSFPFKGLEIRREDLR